MARDNYRYRIEKAPETSINKFLKFLVWIERKTGSSEWKPIESGHLTIELSGDEAKSCNALKEFMGLVADKVKEKGLAQSDEALNHVLGLFPNGEWPEGGVTQSIDLS